MNIDGHDVEFHPDWTKPWVGVSHFKPLIKSKMTLQMTVEFFNSVALLKIFDTAAIYSGFREEFVFHGSPEENIPKVIATGKEWAEKFRLDKYI